MSRILSARVDSATAAAVDEFCRETGMTKTDAINVLLATGLGRERMERAQGSSPIETERQEFSQDAPQPTVETIANGMPTATAGVQDVAALQGPIDPGPDLEVEAVLDRSCWGLWESETGALAAAPRDFILAPGLRDRTLAIVREVENVPGFERGSTRSALYLSARIEGLSAEDALATLKKQNPFTLNV